MQQQETQFSLTPSSSGSRSFSSLLHFFTLDAKSFRLRLTLHNRYRPNGRISCVSRLLQTQTGQLELFSLSPLSYPFPPAVAVLVVHSLLAEPSQWPKPGSHGPVNNNRRGFSLSFSCFFAVSGLLTKYWVTRHNTVPSTTTFCICLSHPLTPFLHPASCIFLSIVACLFGLSYYRPRGV